MINIPSDFNSARAFDGSSAPALTIGGHVCKIQGAKVETARSGAEMLVIAFDIAEGGEFDGYYNARHERSKQYRQDAKWPGVFRAPILTREGKTSGYFKGFITAVEESNAGYKFSGDESTLRGKTVGFNFGEEEYMYNGELRTSIKPFWAASANRVREGLIPPQKKALRTQPGQSMAAQGFTEVPEDSLPELPF